MPDVASLLLLAVLGLVFLAVPVFLIWLFGRLVAALVHRILRGNAGARIVARRWQLGAYAAAVAFLSYQVYTAIYPSDDFFLGEFAEVTLRKPPSSATVVAKSASYPDLHGDYCSFSRIQIDPSSYAQLLQELATDNRFSEGTGVGSREQDAVHKAVAPQGHKRAFAQTVPNHPDHYLSIAFLEDATHVEVSVCYT